MFLSNPRALAWEGRQGAARPLLSTLLVALVLLTGASAATAGAATLQFIDAQGEPVTEYHEGGQIYLRVVDAGLDYPGFLDLAQVDLTSEITGDVEYLELWETGPSTGIFEGSLPSRLTTAILTFNGEIEIWGDPGPPPGFDTIHATYLDSAYNNLAASVGMIGSQIELVRPDGSPTASVAGLRAHLRLEAPSRDSDLQSDVVDVTVTALTSGDSELVRLVESLDEAGVFEGYVELVHASSPSGDGRLEVFTGETIEACHVDPAGYSETVDQAEVVDAAVEIIDAQGQPTDEVIESDFVRLRITSGVAASPLYTTSLIADLTTLNAGDFESLSLDETSLGSGVFEGEMRLSGLTFSGSGVLDIYTSGSPELITAAHGSASQSATTVEARVRFVDSQGQPVSEIIEGTTVHVEVFQPAVNDSTFFDQVPVTLESPLSGDSETLYLDEVFRNSGLFRGALEFGGSTAGDGLIDAPGGSTLRATRDPSYTGQPPIIAEVPVQSSRARFVDAAGDAAESYLEKGRVFIEVYDPWADLDSAAVETVSVDLVMDYGQDSETLVLVESGAGTAIFSGSIPLDSDYGVTPGDGVLQVRRFFSDFPTERLDTVLLTYADAAGNTVSDSARILDSRLTLLDETGAPAETFLIGVGFYAESLVRVRLERFEANADALSVEQATVQLRAFDSGDEEDLTLVETGPDTGIFEATIELDDHSFATSQDGSLSCGDGDRIEAAHVLGIERPSYARATAVVAKLSFIDAAGEPVSAIPAEGVARLRLESLLVGNPFSVDQIQSKLYSTLDQEWLTLLETGPGTGVYEGSLELGQGSGQLATRQLVLLDDPDRIYASFEGVRISAPTVAATFEFIDRQGQPVTEYALGATIRVRVEDHVSNQDPAVIGTRYVGVYSPFDNVEITLVETGPATSIFVGEAASSETPSPSYDDVLTVAAGAHLDTVYDTTAPSATVRIGENRVPEAVDDAVTTPIDTAILIPVLANDSDPELGALTLVAISSPANGAVVDHGDGTVTYTPSAGFSGVDVFEYLVADPEGAEAKATVTVTVNAPPASTITAPADGTTVNMGDNVIFTGTASDAEDGDLTASIAWSSSLDGALGSGGSVSSASLSTGVHTITASVSDSNGAPGNATITLTVNGAPTASITAPATGTTVAEGTSVTFTGTASDGEDGDLAASLAWSSSLDGALGTGGSINAASLSVGVHAITASVTDSGGLPASSAITLTVDALPTVTITAPANGTTVNEGDNVSFTGTASDTEDGDLTASLSWSSSLDGALGSGGSVSTASLSTGVHTITASVSDANGAPGSATVTVTVNGGPAVSITAPANATTVAQGTGVSFTGTASDTEDGDLTSSISWSSSLDGALGTGGSVSTSSLSVGVHTITATVTDSGGLPASSSLILTVNAHPEVSVLAPTNGAVFTQGTSVGLLGTATDAEDGDLAASLAWTSSLDGALGTGGSLSVGTLSLGVHTLTASVADSNGAPASASVSITINAAPAVTITTPADGLVVGLGDEITFSGSATDVEDGDLGANLTWTSDLDGTIGSGGTFATTALSLGTHLVTAAVTDSQGAGGSAAITVIVKQPIQVVITSISSEDGYVLESNENSDIGGSANNGNGPGANGNEGVRMGDAKKDEQYKGILSFDTSSLPDGAILRQATLRLRRDQVAGNNPFTTHGEARVDVHPGGLGGNTSIQTSDFQATATRENVALLSNAPADLDWSEALIEGNDLVVGINKTGTTQMRVYFELDDNDDRREDFIEYFAADHSDPANHPQLVITYLD